MWHSIATKYQIDAGFVSAFIDKHSKRIVGRQEFLRQPVCIVRTVLIEVRLHRQNDVEFFCSVGLLFVNQLDMLKADFSEAGSVLASFKGCEDLVNRNVANRMDRNSNTLLATLIDE